MLLLVMLVEVEFAAPHFGEAGLDEVIRARGKPHPSRDRVGDLYCEF